MEIENDTKKVDVLYNKLKATLNEEQQLLLLELDDEYMNREVNVEDESLAKGKTEGLKMAIRKILDEI